MNMPFGQFLSIPCFCLIALRLSDQSLIIYYFRGVACKDQ